MHSEDPETAASRPAGRDWRRRFWLPALEKSIGGHLRFHDLTHNHAAQLIAQGEHVKVIADRLGHASPMVTLTTYAHLFDGLDRDAADRLDDAWTRSVTDLSRTQDGPRRDRGTPQESTSRQETPAEQGLLVEPGVGIEPTTTSLQEKRSTD